MADDTLTMTFEGLDVMERRLGTAAIPVSRELGVALYQEAQIEMKEMKRRTPVDEGHLRSSGTVDHPVIKPGDEVSVHLFFGGQSAPYAIYVHEDLEAFHKVGQAKFCESVIAESAPYLPARIARRIELRRMIP